LIYATVLNNFKSFLMQYDIINYIGGYT